MTAKLCRHCGINPLPNNKCQTCASCQQINLLKSRAHFNKLAEAKRSAARAEKSKHAVCRCGCGIHVAPPNKYAEGCKERHHAANREADLERTRLARLKAKEEEKLAPPKPKASKWVGITEEQQRLINKEVFANGEKARAKVNPAMLAQRLLRGSIVQLSHVEIVATGRGAA